MNMKIPAVITAAVCTALIAAFCADKAYAGGGASATENGIAVDSSNFPDSYFRSCILQGGIDTDGNGSLSRRELAEVKTLDLSGGVSDLTGIEYFENLEALDCSGGNISSIDTDSNPHLSSLFCQNCGLTSLNISGSPALTVLDCSSNAIESLDLSSVSGLSVLNCSYNSISQLDLGGCSELTFLSVCSNRLAALDVTSAPKLETLFCQDNEIASLSLTQNPSVTAVNCKNNKLAFLNIGNNAALNSLNCSGCGLTVLDVSGCPSLNFLSCGGNSIVTLNTEGCGSLSYLDCTGNRLSALNAGSALKTLLCGDNAIASLDLRDCGELTRIDCKNNELTALYPGSAAIELDCSGNRLTSLDLSGCTALKSFACEGNEYIIDSENDVFDLYSLGSGFRTAFASDWQGAVFSPFDNTISEFWDNAVTYKYNCGNGMSCRFTLKLRSPVVRDEISQVVIKPTDSAVTLDTSYILDVDELDAASDVILQKAAAVYDISLLSGGAEVKTDGMLKISVPLPEGVNGRRAKVCRKNPEGGYTDMKAEYSVQSGMLTFSADSLGLYAVIEADILPGDLNGNGTVDNGDLKLMMYAVSSEEAGGSEAADMDGNGVIDNIDLLLLKSMIS